MSPVGANDRKYRSFADCLRLPVGDGKEFVYSPLTRAGRILSAQTARLLMDCRPLATLDEHISRLCTQQGLRPDQSGLARRLLEGLVDARLLVSDVELMAKCGDPSDQAPAAIAWLGIPTRNRPEDLHRCVVSYLEASRGAGRDVAFVVVDDSDGREIRSANEHFLATLATYEGVKVAYAGHEERAAFAANLAAHSGVSREVVDFALLNPESCPIATGASRNALLLHGLGSCILQVDDDTLGRLRAVPEPVSGLALTSQYDPTQFWFSYEQEDVAPASNLDLATVHERLLGKSLANCLADFQSGEVDFDGADSRFFRKLEKQGGHVAFTQAGVYGDSGMGSTACFLALEGAARSRLLSSPERYGEMLRGAPLLRGVRRAHISDGAFCMSLNLGIDARTLMPPFMPVGRNQDGIFAAVHQRAAGVSLLGYLPWLVAHETPRRRKFRFWESPPRTTSGDMLLGLVELFHPRPDAGAMETGLAALGKSLHDCATGNAGDFEELLRVTLWKQASRQIALLEAGLERHREEPDYWARDVRRRIAALCTGMASPSFAVPNDLETAFGTAQALPRLQRLVRLYGELLQSWSAVWDATARLPPLARSPR